MSCTTELDEAFAQTDLSEDLPCCRVESSERMDGPSARVGVLQARGPHITGVSQVVDGRSGGFAT